MNRLAGAASAYLYAGTFFRAADWLLTGGSMIVVAETTTRSDLALTALATYRSRKVVVRTPSPITYHPSPITHYPSPITYHP